MPKYTVELTATELHWILSQCRARQTDAAGRTVYLQLIGKLVAHRRRMRRALREGDSQQTGGNGQAGNVDP